MPHSVEQLRTKANAHGQAHLFAFYDQVDPKCRQRLLDEIAQVDFDLIDKLVKELVKNPSHAAPEGKLEPPPVITIPKTETEQAGMRAARQTGEEAFRAGRVGCFLVAGGQGTRLGLHGPKGAFVIGPITNRTLFQIHAEKILALRRRYKAQVPWLIMTSDANDTETRAFFEEHNYFNLGKETVRIFKQSNMPAVDRSGKILMQSKCELALSPNGHGGSIKALWDSGSIAWLKTIGVDTLFYFQVDNVLTKIGDPAFIGFHRQGNADMSSKVCRKRDWKEKVGLLALRGGKLSVIEYSDLPENIARETDADGKLRWWAGSIAIHVIAVDFIERLNKGGFQLPYHRADKAVPCIGPDGQPVELKAGEKNGIKFETFVFDALTQARTTVNMETSREDDFSPVKNAEGEDSPATAQRDLMEQYASWLSAVGARLPRKGAVLDCRIEISPLTSLEGENLASQSGRAVNPGEDLLL